MKTLYISRGNNILIETENNTANKLESSRQGIDNLFIAKEPMHVVYGYGEDNEEFDVDTNDIIITFYPKEFKNKALVIKNEKWLENITEYDKAQQEEKERWASINTPIKASDDQYEQVD